MSKTLKCIYQFPPEEKIIGICNYRDVIVVATDRNVYKVINIDDEELMEISVVCYNNEIDPALTLYADPALTPKKEVI